MTDPNGFFRVERLLPLKQSFKVLPAMSNPETCNLPSSESTRCLSMAFIDCKDPEWARSCSSFASMLQVIRQVDCMEVSARRDKLMTRQYESEVPIRLQLFLDGFLLAYGSEVTVND